MSAQLPAVQCCCGGSYVQAFRCGDENGIDMWAPVGAPMTGGVVAPGVAFIIGGICFFWGATISASPGGTVVDVSALTAYANCDVCLGSMPTPGCYGTLPDPSPCFVAGQVHPDLGTRTPTRWTCTFIGVTACPCEPAFRFKAARSPNGTWTLPWNAAAGFWRLALPPPANPMGVKIYSDSICTPPGTDPNLAALPGGAVLIDFNLTHLQFTTSPSYNSFYGDQVCTPGAGVIVIANFYTACNQAAALIGIGGVAVLTPC